jgi:hypothetical protein
LERLHSAPSSRQLFKADLSTSSISEPTIAVHLSITMDGKPFDVRFERSSNWEGEVLVFTDTTDTPNGELTISFRYHLEDSGRRLRATEQLRGAGREQDNVWVFDRAE